VIPAKPKPGRKPKKDTNATVNEEVEVGSSLFLLRNPNPNGEVRTVGGSRRPKTQQQVNARSQKNIPLGLRTIPLT